MAYTIRIGEEMPRRARDAAGARYTGVRFTTRRDAPALGVGGAKTGNVFVLSSMEWATFCFVAGLEAVFDRGETPEGAVRFGRDDLVRVERALNMWREKYPGTIPLWLGGFDARNLALLIWLHDWMKWAIENCERPAWSNE